MGGVWLAYHLWQHYLFSGDETFLKEVAYPAMKGCIAFLDEYLRDGKGKDGKVYFVSPVSISPEHMGLRIGPTMDHQMARQLYKAAIQAEKILNKNSKENYILEKRLERIAPDFISETKFEGENILQEWLEDIDHLLPDISYCHLSHMWGVYPANEVTVYQQGEKERTLFSAYRSAFLRRMSGEPLTAWCTAWRQAICARMLMPEKAYEMLCKLITKFSAPNLFSIIIPTIDYFKDRFQLDANMGGASAIAEMLVQSTDKVITLLPALPVEWKIGRICGIQARGGYTVDVEWEEGKMTYATIKVIRDGIVMVRYLPGIETFDVYCQEKSIVSWENPNMEHVVCFYGESGRTYIIKNR